MSSWRPREDSGHLSSASSMTCVLLNTEAWFILMFENQSAEVYFIP